MLKQFLHHIDQNKLFIPTNKILLAISGGIDSMVMFHLFRQAGFEIGVAHCNFQLRGEASEGDEKFVTETCLQHQVPVHNTAFDTEIFARESGQSIQMAARELRYRFFDEVIKQHGYDCLATAHHLNDSLETVLLNFVRGTGVDGLAGISVKQNNCIRPLLFATRNEIELYAREHGLRWREDASNASNAYHRNLLRNEVIPILKQLNPSLEKGFKETQERVHGAVILAKQSVARFKEQAVTAEGHISIKKAKLMVEESPAVLLWEIIKEKGFNYVQCKDITSVNHLSGKIFYSNTHQLTVDRDNLILSDRKKEEHAELEIDQNLDLVLNGSTRLTFQTFNRRDFELVKDAAVAQLDADTVMFPLTWRSWKEGDHFVPFGMQQSKKISDYLIDAKVPIPDKQQVTVLESGGVIVWVVGYRISDKFKITEKTKQVVVIKRS